MAKKKETEVVVETTAEEAMVQVEMLKSVPIDGNFELGGATIFVRKEIAEILVKNKAAKKVK